MQQWERIPEIGKSATFSPVCRNSCLVRKIEQRADTIHHLSPTAQAIQSIRKANSSIYTSAPSPAAFCLCACMNACMHVGVLGWYLRNFISTMVTDLILVTYHCLTICWSRHTHIFFSYISMLSGRLQETLLSV